MLFWKFRFLKSLTELARDPGKTENVFRLSDLLRAHASPSSLKQFEERIGSDPGFKALYESGNPDLLTLPYDLEQLALLSPDSLGGQYSKFMKKNGLSPEFFPAVEGKDRLSFLQTRIRKTHDIWHVLTGFETDVPGELGLMGFYLSQLESAFPLAILAGGMLHLIAQTDVTAIRRTFDKIVRGYLLGKSSKKIYGLHFESMWERNLRQLRRELGISIEDSAPYWGTTAEELHGILAGRN